MTTKISLDVILAILAKATPPTVSITAVEKLKARAEEKKLQQSNQTGISRSQAQPDLSLNSDELKLLHTIDDYIPEEENKTRAHHIESARGILNRVIKDSRKPPVDAARRGNYLNMANFQTLQQYKSANYDISEKELAETLLAHSGEASRQLPQDYKTFSRSAQLNVSRMMTTVTPTWLKTGQRDIDSRAFQNIQEFQSINPENIPARPPCVPMDLLPRDPSYTAAFTVAFEHGQRLVHGKQDYDYLVHLTMVWEYKMKLFPTYCFGIEVQTLAYSIYRSIPYRFDRPIREVSRLNEPVNDRKHLFKLCAAVLHIVRQALSRNQYLKRLVMRDVDHHRYSINEPPKIPSDMSWPNKEELKKISKTIYIWAVNQKVNKLRVADLCPLAADVQRYERHTRHFTDV